MLYISSGFFLDLGEEAGEGNRSVKKGAGYAWYTGMSWLSWFKLEQI